MNRNKLNNLKVEMQSLMDQSIKKTKDIHDELELDAHSLYLQYVKHIESYQSVNKIDYQINEFKSLYNIFLESNSRSIYYHNKNLKLSAQIALMEKL